MMLSKRTFPSESVLTMTISNHQYTRTVDDLSSYLSQQGRREDALEAVLEVVDLRRQLATDHHTAFDAELARSLNNLSRRLRYLGRREDALKATIESLNLYRQLADRPATFNADLARSLK